MYKQQSVSWWRKKYNLSEDYTVDGFLCYGSWDAEWIKQIFIEICSEQYEKWFVVEWPLQGFMGPILSVIINWKRIWFVVEYGWVKLSEYLHRACMFGSKWNILVWSCWWLNHELQTNDIIIPSFSFWNESSTRMYERNWSNKHFPSPVINQKLKYWVEKQLLSCFERPTITCGAMLAETWEDVVHRSEDWFYGVEMEASTIFAVSNYFQVPAWAIVFVSDNLIKEQIVGDETYAALKDERKKLKYFCIWLTVQTVLDMHNDNIE